MGIDTIKELFERSDSNGSKSTILKPITWLLSILISGIIILVRVQAPNWTVVLFSIIVGFTIVIFFFAFIYCLFYDRDALRSEKFSIQKMAIEKGLYGDNISGTFISTNSNQTATNNNILNSSAEGGEEI